MALKSLGTQAFWAQIKFVRLGRSRSGNLNSPLDIHAVEASRCKVYLTASSKLSFLTQLKTFSRLTRASGVGSTTRDCTLSPAKWKSKWAKFRLRDSQASHSPGQPSSYPNLHIYIFTRREKSVPKIMNKRSRNSEPQLGTPSRRFITAEASV